MTPTKYATLVNILDTICAEAPLKYKACHPDATNTESVNAARSRAYIHLYLKVMHGLIDFEEREKHITDGNGDGGLDAYFIDPSKKRITLLQSKFRINEKNFREKEIALTELLKMELERIVKGETLGRDGQTYNGKIVGLQRKLGAIPDIPSYDWQVVILANLKKVHQDNLNKLTDNMKTEVMTHARAYDELVFPIVSGNYYNESQLLLTLDLTSAVSSSARLKYEVDTAAKKCDISLFFVPAIEIGKALSKYRNTILELNPRSYLELDVNDVNTEIAETITDKTTNEFALFNNGITMLSDETSFTDRTGTRGSAQILLTNPQVLNGGQTAFTLSRLYEQVQRGELDKKVFQKKDVLLKIITFPEGGSATREARLKLIESISRATNFQTPVKDADRRSNDKIQVDIQQELFSRYGCYYERKLGEFADGIRDGYIVRDQVIDRTRFMRACKASQFEVSQARGLSANALFAKDNFRQTLQSTAQVEEYLFAYRCVEELGRIERQASKNKADRWGTAKYGQALHYGKYAVAAACTTYGIDVTPAGVEGAVSRTLARWLTFEKKAFGRKANSDYFPTIVEPETGNVTRDADWGGYYKGRTVNADVKGFFRK